jgi:hypothetical protein
MVIKYNKIFHSETLQNLPKLGFLVWKQTIWQPWNPRCCYLYQISGDWSHGFPYVEKKPWWTSAQVVREKATNVKEQCYKRVKIFDSFKEWSRLCTIDSFCIYILQDAQLQWHISFCRYFNCMTYDMTFTSLQYVYNFAIRILSSTFANACSCLYMSSPIGVKCDTYVCTYIHECIDPFFTSHAKYCLSNHVS